MVDLRRVKSIGKKAISHGKKFIAKHGPTIAGGLIGEQINKALFKPHVKKNVEPGGSGKRANDGAVLTKQYDTSLVYKRPRQKKRKVTFAKKVQAVMNKTIEPFTLSKLLSQGSTTTAGAQNSNSYGFWTNGANNVDNDFTDVFGVLNSSLGQKIMTRSNRVDFTLQNLSSGSNAVIKVYTIYAKNSLAVGEEDPTKYWQDASTAASGNLALSSFDVAYTAGAVNTQDVIWSQPGSSPFQCTAFCKKFTIAQVREFLLSPGEISCFTETHMVKKPISYEEVQGIKGLKKVSKWVMIVTYGLPATGASVPVSNATTFPAVSFNYTTQQTKKWDMISTLPAHAAQTRNFA